MGKRLIFSVLAAVLASGVLHAETPEPPINKDTVRQAITIFRQNPTGAQADMARALIVRFADASPDVVIAMKPKVLPWLEDAKVPKETANVLLAAFVAGDTRAQLDRGKAKDDPVAGTEQVIATYRQLQKAQPSLKVSGVEGFIELQKQGKLAQHLQAP